MCASNWTSASGPCVRDDGAQRRAARSSDRPPTTSGVAPASRMRGHACVDRGVRRLDADRRRVDVARRRRSSASRTARSSGSRSTGRISDDCARISRGRGGAPDAVRRAAVERHAEHRDVHAGQIGLMRQPHERRRLRGTADSFANRAASTSSRLPPCASRFATSDVVSSSRPPCGASPGGRTRGTAPDATTG